MARRHVAEKREVLPDPKYGSQELSSFINVLMVDGKKSVAEKIAYGSLEEALFGTSKQSVQENESGQLDEAYKGKILDLFSEVVEKVTPTVEVRSRRVGGATYQVPVEVRPGRGLALAMRWIIESARKRSEKGMVKRLCAEFLDILQKRGASLKKREDTHKMAKANQAFAHFRW